MGALDGILVVSLEQAVAAPFASSRLADAGARVIKIERSEGDFARAYDTVARGQSTHFVWLNRGKESLVLDIKDADDAALLHRILARADVFIQNLAPGAAERAGFGAEALRRRHPRLVTCDISGFGEAGPLRDRKAYDLLIQAESGLASVTGSPDAPGRVGVSVCDIAAGLYAYSGILEALIERGRTGQGRGLQVSLFDTVADWMNVPLLIHDYGGAAPKRVGLNHPLIAPYGVFATRDGGQIVIAIQNEREWAAFCAEVMEDAAMASDPNFAGNEARLRNRPVLDGRIAAVFGELDRDTLIARLARARTAFAAVNEVADLSRHPHLRRVAVETPAGPIDLASPPVRAVGRSVALGPVPVLGEHSESIRREFAEPAEKASA